MTSGKLAITAALVMSLTACGADATTTETGADDGASPAPAEPTVAADARPGSADGPTRSQHAVTFDDPQTAQTSAYEVAITGITFTSRSAADQAPGIRDGNADYLLDPATRTVISVDFTATNTSGQVLDWYPAQAVLVQDSQRVEASPGLGQLPAPADGWQPGIERSGRTAFQSNKALSTYADGGSLRLMIQQAREHEGFSKVAPATVTTVDWPAAR